MQTSSLPRASLGKRATQVTLEKKITHLAMFSMRRPDSVFFSLSSLVNLASRAYHNAVRLWDVVTADEDQRAQMWDPHSAQSRAHIDGVRADRCRFAHDGQSAALLGPQGLVALWRLFLPRPASRQSTGPGVRGLVCGLPPRQPLARLEKRRPHRPNLKDV